MFSGTPQLLFLEPLLVEDPVLLQKYYTLKEKGAYLSNLDFLHHLLDEEYYRQVNLPLVHQRLYTPDIESNPDSIPAPRDGSTHALLLGAEDKGATEETLQPEAGDFKTYVKASEPDPEAIKPRRKKKKKRGAERHSTGFGCYLCPKLASLTSAELKSHFDETHPGDKPYRCEICGLTCTMNSSLKKHRLQHSIHRPLYECAVCAKQFTKKANRDEHMRLHTGDLFHCSLCHRGFVSKRHLTNHEAVHTKVKKFTCDVCGKKFMNRTFFTSHQQLHQGKVFRCDLCGKDMASEMGLRQHRTTHSIAPKQHACDVCGKTFRTAGELRGHIVIHDPNRTKSIHCQLCNKSFYKNQELKNHMRMHNDERQFVCEICNKGFHTAQVLKKHRIIHTNLRPYKCSLCPSDFNHSAALYTHVKMQHKGKKLKLSKIVEKVVKYTSEYVDVQT